MCEDHGIALYLLSYVLTGRLDLAQFLVAEAIGDLSAQPIRASHGEAHSIRYELARLIYLGSSRLRIESARLPPPEHAARAITDPMPLPEAMTRISTVSIQQREAIALCLYGDHTHRDAAELLHLPAPRIARLLSTGLHELAAGYHESDAQRPDLTGRSANLTGDNP